jgi:hypothetical protein
MEQGFKCVFMTWRALSISPYHTAAMAIVDELEARVPTRASLALFRESPALASYFKRWNLSVYFTLRFQDIAGAMEVGTDGQCSPPRRMPFD